VLSGRLKTADRSLARLLSKHCGAAAYIVSRAGAEEILDHCRRLMLLPIDHLLFNPNNSPLFARLSPWQLFPAVAQQHAVHGTDIHPLRLQQCPTGLRYVRRELVRAWYETRRLPEQLGSLLRGEAMVQQVAFR
jgi:glycosyl transferase family 25